MTRVGGLEARLDSVRWVGEESVGVPMEPKLEVRIELAVRAGDGRLSFQPRAREEGEK